MNRAMTKDSHLLLTHQRTFGMVEPLKRLNIFSVYVMNSLLTILLILGKLFSQNGSLLIQEIIVKRIQLR